MLNNNFIGTLKISSLFVLLDTSKQFEHFYLRRNYIFIHDFKLFLKYLFLFFKKLKIFLFKSSQQSSPFASFNGKMKLYSHFFFIAERRDGFFYNLFLILMRHFSYMAFFIEWDSSQFFFFLRKKKQTTLHFFPLIFVAPSLYSNLDFMNSLKMLTLYPIFFFLVARQYYFALQDRSIYNNIFFIFLTKKNSLKFLFLFFKVFKTFVKS